MQESVAALDFEKVARPFLIAYCCVNGTTSRKYLKEQTAEDVSDSGVLRVLVPCVGRLSMADLLSPFELGADRVAVISCPEDGCYYPRVEDWLARRITPHPEVSRPDRRRGGESPAFQNGRQRG